MDPIQWNQTALIARKRFYLTSKYYSSSVLSAKRYFLEIGPVHQKLWPFERMMLKTLNSNFLDLEDTLKDTKTFLLRESEPCRAKKCHGTDQRSCETNLCSIPLPTKVKITIQFGKTWHCSTFEDRIRMASQRQFRSSKTFWSNQEQKSKQHRQQIGDGLC